MKRSMEASSSADATSNCCSVHEFQPNAAPISTGIGYLDHMLDQFYSHAQIAFDLQMGSVVEEENNSNIHGCDNETAVVVVAASHNRNAKCDQVELLSYVGEQVGNAVNGLLLRHGINAGQVSTFACPLDEALTVCVLERVVVGNGATAAAVAARDGDGDVPRAGGELESYTLGPPYGKYPSTGRLHIGTLETAAIESFWEKVAETSGLSICLDKIRGDNAHHIVESSFKAFSRALRNLLDHIDTESFTGYLIAMYGANSKNYKAGINMKREATISRNTKETSILTALKFDGGASGVDIRTGVTMLDRFLKEVAVTAGFSLKIECNGDLWIDDHHTAEDVAIAVGQVINEALGTKAGLNRMWCATSTIQNTKIHVTMDLSNRPCLTHNLLSLETAETVGDLSTEMFEHVLDSIVVNARMTVHIVECINNDEEEDDGGGGGTENVENAVMATARAFGQALKYCAMVDGRRAGATASSKGTLSV